MRFTSRSLFFLVTLLSSPRVGAEIVGNVLRDAHGIELVVPEGWELSELPTYPSVVAWAWQRDGAGRMTLAGEPVGSTTATQAYANRQSERLRQIGFRIIDLLPHVSGAYVLDALSGDRRVRIKQAYWLRQGWAHIVTFAIPAQLLRSYKASIEESLRSTKFFEAERSVEMETPLCSPASPGPASLPTVSPVVPSPTDR